jgi:voltage-gated potassium channel Kch
MIHLFRRHHHFMMSYTRALITGIIRPVMFYLVIMAFTAINIGAGLFWLIEHEANPNLHNYLDALYFTTATMTTVGYGDITAVTGLGRGLAICLMLSGTAIFVCFTAVLSTSIIDIEMRAELEKFSGSGK